MPYQVIARKWRPQVFEEVVGQEAITRTLRNGVETGRIHHAYLFSGARGVGKTTTARLLAKSLNCQKTEKPNPVPCDLRAGDACDSCAEIASSRSIDVLEFDAASHTKVEEIREIILESISINPARDRFRVFIIDEVHMLSKSSFNALLKTLEEPPENVVFVLATTELHKVPDTVLSRCQQFEFRTIPRGKILARLSRIASAEDVEISENALREIARSGEGSMRDAESNFDQVISFSSGPIKTSDVSGALGIASTENLSRVVRSVANREAGELLKVVDDLIERGHDLRNFCRDLLAFIRDLLVFKIAGDAHGLFDTSVLGADEMYEQSAPFLEADLIRFFNSLSETEVRLRDASEPRYILEIGLVKLIEMQRVSSIEEIIERLAAVEEHPGKSAAAGADPPRSVSTDSEKKTPEREPEGRVTPRERQIQEKSADKQTARDNIGQEEDRPHPKAAAAPAETALEETVEVTRPRSESSGGFSREEMPVKLLRLSTGELSHTEDKKLDKAFEDRLAKEGDDLRIVKGGAALIREATSGLDQDSKAKGGRENSATQERPPVSNRAIDIALSMVAEESDDERERAEPDESVTDEQLAEYARDHPLIRMATRLFRARVVDVKRTG